MEPVRPGEGGADAVPVPEVEVKPEPVDGITIEKNEYDEDVRVTRRGDTVIRELVRPTPEDPNAEVIAEMQQIERATGMSRLLRETLAAAPFAPDRLKDVEAQIANLRGRLK